MSDIVEGFKVNVSALELKEHFKKRLGYHTTALEHLSGNKIQLIGAKGETSEIIQKHKAQSKLLAYLVEHIPEGVTYRLSMVELDGLYVLRELTDE